jgi:gluconokinase
VFDHVNHVVKTCLGMLQHQGADAVHSVGITTFAMALVGVDVKSGEPVTPVFTYAGQGSEVNSVANEIISELPERYRKEHQARTGTVLHHPCYATAQLKNFFRINQNTTRSHVALSSIRWTTLGGYVLGRWTGLGHRLPVSLSDAAWTGLLDIHTHQWDSISLGYLGLENDAFAPIAESSTPQTMRLDVPGLTPTETSLLSYTNVHASIGDGLAATIASTSIYGKDHSYSTTKGSRQSRNVSVTIGTSAAARILMSTHTCIQSVGNSRPPVHSGFACKAVDGLFSYRTSNEEVLLGGSLTDAGSLIAWYSTLIGKDRMDVLLNEVEFEYSAGRCQYVTICELEGSYIIVTLFCCFVIYQMYPNYCKKLPTCCLFGRVSALQGGTTIVGESFRDLCIIHHHNNCSLASWRVL